MSCDRLPSSPLFTPAIPPIRPRAVWAVRIATMFFVLSIAWPTETVLRANSRATVATTGTVVAWGYNGNGQVTGTPSEFYAEAQPVVLDGQVLNGVKAIAAGSTHSLALKGNGTVVAWGAVGEDFGQATVPAGLSGVTAISAGGSHSVALKSDGTVVAWGAGATGTGCFPDCGQTMVPAGLGGVTAISAGGIHTLALLTNGTVVAWGANGYDLGQTNVPDGLSGVTAISAGWYHNLALKNDGTVEAWGWDGFGQAQVPAGLTGVTAVAAGFRFSAALKSDGTVVVWGGEGGTNVPAGLGGVTALAANAYDIQALKDDGTVVAWGENAWGAAVVPADLTGVTSIAAGFFHSLGLVDPVPDLHYNFGGFLPPVKGLPATNVVTAGRAIPVMFSLSGDQGLDIFATGYPASGQVGCADESGAPQDPTTTSGGSVLTYDPSTDLYSYVWKTNLAWSGTCRILVVRLADGTDHVARFTFR